MNVPYLQQFSMQPTSAANDLTSAISFLANVLAKREDKLPVKGPDVFKGNVFEYPEWINSTVTQVENKYPKAILSWKVHIRRSETVHKESAGPEH